MERLDIFKAVEIALGLIERFEGFYSKPYLCPAGVPTIGLGSTTYPDGRKVTLKDAAISREQAREMAEHFVWVACVPAITALCPEVDTTERFAALIDFVYNLGRSNLSSSTLRLRIRAGLWGVVPDELMRWVKSGGKTLPGLVTRRGAEAQLV